MNHVGRWKRRAVELPDAFMLWLEKGIMTGTYCLDYVVEKALANGNGEKNKFVKFDEKLVTLEYTCSERIFCCLLQKF